MKTRDSMWAVLIAAIAFGAGCSSLDTNEPHGGDSGLRISSFTAEDAVLDFGDSTVLNWRTAGAATIVLRSGDEILLESSTDSNGLLEVSPTRTLTYELVIRSGAGLEKTASVE